MALGAIGILMNLDTVLLNMAMPVVSGGESGLIEAATTFEVARSTGGFYRVVSQGDLLSWLGDAMPVGLGRSVLMVSPGDVILMIAVVVVIVFGMSQGRDADCA